MDAGAVKGYSELGEGENSYGTRRRNVEGLAHEGPEEEVYGDLQRLRGMVDVMEGDRGKGCFKLSLNNSSMSTIFGIVFIVIITVTVYAFVNLYRALVRRFYATPE